MTFTDQDLRDALQPLAGDPVRDAGLVLNTLPKPKPPLPPVTWWLGGAGLVLGLLLGLAGGFAWGEPAVPKQPPEEEQPPPEDPPPEVKPMPMMEMDIYMMAFGELAVEEPGTGREVLQAGAWGLVMGSTIETTSESQAGVHMPMEDTFLRLDREAVATVEAPRRIRLGRGRIFAHTGGHGGGMTVLTSMGEIVLQNGAAQIAAWPSSLNVLVLEGMATIRTEAGETRRLEARHQLVADRDGVQLRELPFLGTATSWMTEMIRLHQDDTELRKRIVAMVEAYEAGEFRDAAEEELRKLGAGSVALLVYSVHTLGVEDPAYRLRTVDLLTAITDYPRAVRLLQLLAHDDPEVRVRVFQTLKRITGREAGDTEAFWERATPGDRAQGIARWRELLR